MAKIDPDILSQSSRPSVGSIKEFVLFHIILRIQPFFLEFSPYCFRNIQMQGVWRPESNEQSALLPECYPLPDAARFMDAGIIQYQHGLLFDAERKPLQIINDRIGSDVVLRHHSHVLALPVDETQHVDFISLLKRDVDILAGELPSIRHIPLRTDMGFISIIEVDLSRFTEMFKFRNHLYLMMIKLIIGFAFGAGSYPLISSANTFKKRRRVLPLIDFSREASHSALAVCIRCRCFLTDSSKLFLPSTSKTGLRPCPGLFCKPDMPSDLKRLTLWLTLTWLMPVIKPVSLEVRPSAFSRMTWQRLRKQWLSPFFRPCFKDRRSFDDNPGVFTRPMLAKIRNNTK